MRNRRATRKPDFVSINKMRKSMNLPPWKFDEANEPVVLTANGPVPMSKVSELLRRNAKSS